MKEKSVLKISGSNFLSPQKSRARILKTQKARSRTLKIEKVSGSHKKMTVSLSRKVSHLPFTTPVCHCEHVLSCEFHRVL